MNELVLPKEWYGKTLAVEMQTPLGTIEAKLIDANAAGILIEGADGEEDIVFTPWHMVRAVWPPDKIESAKEATNG